MPAKQQNSLSTNPLVSVCVTSYNSAAWLPRALTSALQQQTRFPIEIVIGDDCSSDGTRWVAESWQRRYPRIVRVLGRTARLGMQRNYYDTFEHCRGKYIAWLDADDYWTDPQKLNRQAALLEGDESVSVCGHFTRQVTPSGEVVQARCPRRPPGIYSTADIIAENFVPSPSIFFRNGIHRFLPESFFSLSGLVDWPILLHSALRGKVVLMDGVMADYVLTPGSAYMSKGPLHQDTIDLEFYRELQRTLPERWQREIRAAMGMRYEALAHEWKKRGDIAQTRENAWKAFTSPVAIDNLFSKTKTLLAAELAGRLGPARVAARQR